jgi:uncharacterized protein (DUF2249 family)
MSTLTTSSTPTIVTTIDVRPIPHAQRHPLIFKTFDGLQPGQALVLVVDHDPKPVLFELDFVRTGKFAWSYLEQGPEVWRVQMAKIQ